LLTDSDIEDIYTLVDHSITVEEEILDWIFELGELDNFSKEDLLNFMKYRVDDSLKKIGMKTRYNVTRNNTDQWFGSRKKFSPIHWMISLQKDR
jgi:ribonucleoside-diphosphate reductase beta chain